MSHIEHKERAPSSITAAVLTISDTRTKESDESGRWICDVLRANNHSVIAYDIVKDNVIEIGMTIKKWCYGGGVIADAVITTGGTGFGKRDSTPEAITPLLSKKMEGFGEMFRILSFKEIGSSAILSRAFAGLCNNMIVFCLPGSLPAVKLAINNLILPELPHLVYELKK